MSSLYEDLGLLICEIEQFTKHFCTLIPPFLKLKRFVISRFISYIISHIYIMYVIYILSKLYFMLDNSLVPLALLPLEGKARFTFL